MTGSARAISVRSLNRSSATRSAAACWRRAPAPGRSGRVAALLCGGMPALQTNGARMMPISISRLHPAFAGEVDGLDCRRPLDDDAVAAIEAGMDEYAVLVFR